MTAIFTALQCSQPWLEPSQVKHHVVGSLHAYGMVWRHAQQSRADMEYSVLTIGEIGG